MSEDEVELATVSEELSRVATLHAYAQSTEIAIVAAQVAIHAGVLALFSTRRELDDAIWLLIPLVPYWVTGFHMILGGQATIRGFYVRALERRVHRLSGAMIDLDEATKLASPSYFHLTHMVSSSRSAFPEQKFLYILGIGVMQGLMIAEAIYSILQIDSIRFQLVGTLMYVGLAGLITAYTYRITLAGSNLWRTVLRGLDAGWSRPFGPSTLNAPRRALRPEPAPSLADMPVIEPRGQWRYLLLPRQVVEVANKSLLALVILVIALTRPWHHISGEQVILALGFVISFEFFVYPVRYYLNDVFDVARQIDPLKRRDSRPAIGRSGLAVPVVLSTAVLHLVLGVSGMAACASGSDYPSVQSTIGAILILLAASSASYEISRNRMRSCDSLNPESWVRFTFYGIALWSGYALRAFVALTAGSGGRVSVLAFALFATGSGLLGACTVVLSLSDRAQIHNALDADLLTRRQQGHVQLLFLLDQTMEAKRSSAADGTEKHSNRPSDRHIVPGLPRYRDSSVPPWHPTFWLFATTTGWLVVGTTMLLGEHRALQLAAIGVTMVLVNIGYLLLRRRPTILWTLLLPVLASIFVSLTVPGLTYWDYIWIGTPVLATVGYFEFFRHIPPPQFTDA